MAAGGETETACSHLCLSESERVTELLDQEPMFVVLLFLGAVECERGTTQLRRSTSSGASWN